MRTLVRVEEVVRETPSMVTLRFSYPAPALPGQFVMVWVPGDDEVPMSLSYREDGSPKGITVKVMGSTSRHLTELKVGDRIGIRGPYGNHFPLDGNRVLVVGGGSGTAALAPAAEAAHARGARVDVALGAVTAAELLFRDRLRRIAGDLQVSTDDGSEGHHGFVTALVGPMLASARYDAVWTCGPEIMMSKVMAAAKPLSGRVFGSMERIMWWAINLCDACSLGPYHVCADGPVFTHVQLEGLEDFGRYKRSMAGLRIPV